MEGGKRTTDDDGAKVWIHAWAWSSTDMTLEDATESSRKLAEYAEELGLTRLEGTVSLAREREPVETFSFGSDVPYRNRHARTGAATVAGAIAEGAGAAQHA